MRGRPLSGELTRTPPFRRHRRLPKRVSHLTRKINSNHWRTKGPSDLIGRGSQEALNTEDTRLEAAEIFRGLIDRVVLTPSKLGMKAELYGDLAEILAFCDGQDSKDKLPRRRLRGSQLSMVAGACNHRDLVISI